MENTLLTTAPGQLSRWTADLAYGNLTFRVLHLGLAYLQGRFDEFSAALECDPDDPLASTLVVHAAARSASTGSPLQDRYLRSRAVLRAERNPVITFRSQRVEQVGRGRFRVPGLLTLRGITRPLVLRVRSRGIAVDSLGEERVGFRATAEISRREWGLSRAAGYTAATADGLADRVRIEAEVEFCRARARPVWGA